MTISVPFKVKVTSEQLFMISVLFVNLGNYGYNLFLGRILGPEKFADAAILITFLLILSFIAMTFQLVTAKFSIVFDFFTYQNFIKSLYRKAIVYGVLLGGLIIVFSGGLQNFFKTESFLMFVVFGLGIPVYFIMSINRGHYQGKNELAFLSVTYQLEMLSRVLVTFSLIFLIKINTSTLISIGIFSSLLFGLIPFNFSNIKSFKSISLDVAKAKMVKKFFVITAFYELTQIIINNSDIILVKHYFDAYQAGLYASLALIGRVVYFLSWMFVMLLLPAVIQLNKQGKATHKILLKYVGYTIVIAIVIAASCYLFPELLIDLMFGENYKEIAPLLWKYAAATSLFAISNIFAYYYLSLDNYLPVVLSGIFGILQLVLIIVYHSNLLEVVYMQIIAMLSLLGIQLMFFFYQGKRKLTAS